MQCTYQLSFQQYVGGNIIDESIQDQNLIYNFSFVIYYLHAWCVKMGHQNNPWTQTFYPPRSTLSAKWVYHEGSAIK